MLYSDMLKARFVFERGLCYAHSFSLSTLINVTQLHAYLKNSRHPFQKKTSGIALCVNLIQKV